MNVRQAIIAALRGDPDLVPKVKDSLRERIDDDGKVVKFAQAAEALEPLIADAVRRRPSKLAKLGLRSAHLLGSLAAEDHRSNRKLAKFAHGKTLGIVFVDVAGFTTFTEKEGDNAARKLIARLTEIVGQKAAASRGEVVKKLGDGFLLVFPSASQAVRGAFALRDAVARAAEKDPSFAVSVRCAVHAGEPLVEQDDLFGYDVNLAAHLLDHCKPGQIVVSETAKELSEKRLKKVEFGKRKLTKIRGLSTKVAIYTAEPADVSD